MSFTKARLALEARAAKTTKVRNHQPQRTTPTLRYGANGRKGRKTR